MDTRQYAEYLFEKIGIGSENALRRPEDKRVDRQLRRLIHDANMNDDCIINVGGGYFRPGDDDDMAAEIYFAAERHRARDILRRTRRMETVFNRRYQ